MFIQSIRRQSHREVFVLPPDSDEVIPLKTLDVPAPRVDQDDLERIKGHLLKQRGQKVGTALPVNSNSQGSNGDLSLGRVL